MRRPMSLPLALSALLALVVFSPAARAVDISDAPSGFRISLAPPGAETCAAYPAAQRNPEACPLVQMPPASAFDSARSADPTGLARMAGVVYFARPEWRYFAVLVATTSPNNSVMSSSEIVDYLQNERRGLVGHLPADTTYVPTPDDDHFEELTVNGVQVFRSILQMVVPNDTTGTRSNRLLMYHAVGRGNVVAVTYWYNQLHEAEVRAEADAMIRTVSMPAAPSRAERTGRLIGVLLVCLGLPLLVGIVVVVLVMRRRGNRTPALTGPMGGYGQPGGPTPFGAPGAGWPQQQPPAQGGWPQQQPPTQGGWPQQQPPTQGGWQQQQPPTQGGWPQQQPPTQGGWPQPQPPAQQGGPTPSQPQQPGWPPPGGGPGNGGGWPPPGSGT